MDYFLNDFLLMSNEINVFTVMFRVILAVLFGGIIGNERSRHGSQAGLRTHILVCLGAAMTSLAGLYSVEILGYNGDPFRIAAQAVSGIGFLGAGMIIVKSGNAITGLTTAAGMWTTATIGITLGMGFYAAALIVMIACVFTAAFLTRIERKRKMSAHLYIEVSDISHSGDISETIKDMLANDCNIEITSPKSGQSGAIGLYVITPRVKNIDDLRRQIEKINGVCFAVIE